MDSYRNAVSLNSCNTTDESGGKLKPIDSDNILLEIHEDPLTNGLDNKEVNEEKVQQTIIDPVTTLNVADETQHKNAESKALLLLADNKTVTQLNLDKTKAKRRRTKRYYDQQLALIKNYDADEKVLQKFSESDGDDNLEDNEAGDYRNCDFILSTVTLVANFSLFLAKIIAAVLSGSLVVLSSVIDSAMDLTTGGVIFCTTRAIKKRDLYKYPRGRTRLEPLALIVISLIMGAASVQVIIKSVESMVSKTLTAEVELPTIIIMLCTVVIKLSLMVACYCYPSTNAKILAQDHRNDCISNTTAIVCAYLSYKYWAYLDPIAAIVVSLYIISTWMRTGFQNVRILSGRTAEPEIINRIVKVCMDHKPKVDQIDTVLVYHFGINYLAEVHVVLDKNVTLEKAHDISEPLQRKIERLPFVERAFVHVDYDTQHKPSYEHKVV